MYRIMLKTLFYLALLVCVVSGYPFTGNPIDPRIVGGIVTDIKEVPYQAKLGGGCGAAILDKNWILTAAHCVYRDVEEEVTVGTSAWPSEVTAIPTEGALVHPDYRRNGAYDADVALLKLKTPLTFSESIQTVKLIEVGVETPAGTTALVSGFGRTARALNNGTIRGETPSLQEQLLRSVEVPIVDHKECEELYKDFFIKILETHICAGLAEGGKDSCQGDSGGPMIRMDTKELIGIVSWGRGCARPKYPGVYAKIAEPSIRNWIQKITGI